MTARSPAPRLSAPDAAAGALWALKLEYDGGAFAGWQRQLGQLSVQQVLEEAASRLAYGAPVASIVAGRTDAGVHAAAQVAQIALPGAWNATRLCAALNDHMRPHPVAVLAAAPAPAGWNARFSAIERCYCYVILNRRAPAALERHHVWHMPHPLDAAAMQQAASYLLGSHDFSSFRASSCQAKSPIRTLDALDVTRHGDRVVIEARARSFLHHQIRNIAGTLVWFGTGRREPAAMADVLAAASRAVGGATAPPQGLTLTAVRYADDPFKKIQERTSFL